MAIGPTLQDARLKRQLTASQIAEMTRIKVQIVDDLEHDDFHRIAATIYGKGFIKLFAECVGLDPKPLIADYVRSINGETVDTQPAPPEPAPAPAPEPDHPAPAEPGAGNPASDLFEFASSRRRRITPSHALRSAAEAPASPPPPPAAQSPLQGSVGMKPSPARHHTRSENRPFSATLRNFLQPLRDRGVMLAETLKNRLANLKWSDRMLKRVGIVLAALVVLLVLVAVIRFFANRVGPRPPADHELLLFIPPPEPYVE